MNLGPLKRVGFWTKTEDEEKIDGLLWPGDLVDQTWDTRERAAVVAYLRAGAEGNRYRGMSWCRLCPAASRHPNGSISRMDDAYVWPDGFVHYVEAHGVKPPAEFLAHVFTKICPECGRARHEVVIRTPYRVLGG